MMKEIPPPPHDPLVWVGRALHELLELPDQVKRTMGYALRFAQAGEKHEAAKPLRGFKGAGVLEVVEKRRRHLSRGVYRAICRRRLRSALLPEEI